MPGKVYCFNAYNEPMNKLSVNGMPVPPPAITGSPTGPAIAGWSAEGATIYTPKALPVSRARHGDGQSAPVFPNDVTQLRFEWDSFTANTSLDLTKLQNVSLDDDLILYIAINQMTLMTTRGFVLQSVSYLPSGLTAPAKTLLHNMSHQPA